MVVLLCGGLMAVGSPGVVRPTEWKDLPKPSQALAQQLGITAEDFPKTIAEIDRRTSERLREGSWDHLIYYLLQSRSFTDADPIEPARAAAEYMNDAARAIPSPVKARIQALTRSLASPANERQKIFAELIRHSEGPGEIERQYGRAMRFLYEKEVECRERSMPQACIASLYIDRGLSSDTNTQAFRAVEEGVRWIRKNRPETNLQDVLILGPGLDLAPRTLMQEDAPPRIYQPIQVADLLQTKSVACADVNPLVVSFARAVCKEAYGVNIATHTIDRSAKWDFIIATNMLLYLDDRELLLAMNNIRSMLKPGGVFLHNDGRFSAQLFGKASGLPVVQFGEVVLDALRTPPLTDRFVLHMQVEPSPSKL